MRSAVRLAARSRANKKPPVPVLRRGYASPAATKTSELADDQTQITTLPNGLRVATESTPGHFSSVGVYVDAGSRYESPHLSGTSHILDRMAFKSTTTRGSEDMSTAIDSLGGQILCSSSRETMMYQSSHFHSATPLAMSLLADTLRRPLFSDDEVSAVRDAVAYEVREINAKPELIMPELLHQVAYQGNTLGNPLLCPEERLDVVDGDLLREYTNTWYRPDRMVIAGAGMEHQQLVDLAYEHFGDVKLPTQAPSISTSTSTSRASSIPTHLLPPSARNPSSASLYKSLTTAATSLFNPSPLPSSAEPSFAELSTARARYTGGHHFIHRTDLDHGATHVYLGFDGLSIHDPDIYALATIQILLGGGGSFSAGGPGKGMYSRLYTHVLNLHSAIDHCSSFHHIYTDTSLFGLSCVAMQGYPTSSILPLLAHQLSLLLYHPIPKTELARAKNQLSSSLVMALESRSVEVEDLGRQVLVHGRKIGVDEMVEKIQNVKAEDIRRVAGRVVGSGMRGPPTILVMGKKDLGAGGEWESVFKKQGLGGL